jgi:serralysin
MSTENLRSNYTLDVGGVSGCQCPICTGGSSRDGDTSAVHASLDPDAGLFLGSKEIWTLAEITAHLNREGRSWNAGAGNADQSDSDDTVINFGFHVDQASLQANGYVFAQPGTGDFKGVPEYFNFAAFSEAQKAAARKAIQFWDDVVAVTFAETAINDADIAFGNLAAAPGTQAYAYYPNPEMVYNSPDYTPAENANIRAQLAKRAGDVWISASAPDNFQLDEGLYGLQVLTHEVGHAIGLSHPGKYDAGEGVAITYAADAEYAQDTRAYSLMSYFDAGSIGARHFDFHLSALAYGGVPMIHDIAAAQAIYGADMTTRTGNTVYGFNSNAGRDAFDFVKTPAPVMAIWDAGGIDTIDASGYVTEQLIDLRAGSLSSIGGVTFDTAPSFAQVNANRAAAGYDPVSQATYDANMAALQANAVVGRLTDNVGIAYGVTIENAIGGSGKDTIVGNDVANLLKGNGGNDEIDGGGGSDTAQFSGARSGYSLTRSTVDGVEILTVTDTDTSNGDDGVDKIKNVELLSFAGAAFQAAAAAPVADDDTNMVTEDALVEAAQGNVLDGDADANGDPLTVTAFQAQGGSSALAGATVQGKYGTLKLNADGSYTYTALGDLIDTLASDATDVFTYTVKDPDGLSDTATLTITINERDDYIITNGTTGHDTIEGDRPKTGAGTDDRINAGTGNDTVYGFEGADDLYGGSGNDKLFGGKGWDELFGESGVDTLDGGAGIDFLDGGTGNDWMTGGSEADTFIFKTGNGYDTITDFQLGTDKLVIEGITVRTLTSKDVDGNGKQDLIITFGSGGGNVTLLDVGGRGVTLDQLINPPPADPFLIM